MTNLLELKDINKGFSGVSVLQNVSLTVRSGSVLALAGENGAGKSTLMKIIAGIYQRDSGVITFKGQDVTFTNARQSIGAGIAIIHQELNLLDHMSVCDNIFLGREKSGLLGTIDRQSMRDETRRWLEILKQDFDVDTRVGSLSVAQQQMVEIARALSMNADVIIMDEPTDALTDIETDVLFDVVKDLTEQGKGLVFISHRLGELFRICDDIAILRDGHMVHQGPMAEMTEHDLIRHMVGRELSDQYPHVPAQVGTIRLELENFSAAGVHDISFTAHAGEVVGFGGLMGAGRTELAQAIYGANPVTSGRMAINGTTCKIQSPRDGVQAGIGYVTEDRKVEGLIQAHGLRQNMSLTGLTLFSTKWGRVDKRAERAKVAQYIQAFSIKTHGMDTITAQLSGGNQQKVSIAKSLIPEPHVLILDEPTRGVDVGAKREIYSLINDLKAEGMCILLMTSDMPELLGISDRIFVLAQGRVTGRFAHADATQEKIMRSSIG